MPRNIPCCYGGAISFKGRRLLPGTLRDFADCQAMKDKLSSVDGQCVELEQAKRRASTAEVAYR